MSNFVPLKNQQVKFEKKNLDYHRFLIKSRLQCNTFLKFMQKKMQIHDSGELQNLVHFLGLILVIQLHGILI